MSSGVLAFLRRHDFGFSAGLVERFPGFDELNLLETFIREDGNFLSSQVFLGHEIPPSLLKFDDQRGTWFGRFKIPNGPWSMNDGIGQSSICNFDRSWAMDHLKFQISRKRRRRKIGAFLGGGRGTLALRSRLRY